MVSSPWQIWAIRQSIQQNVSFQFAVTAVLSSLSLLSDFQRPGGHMMEAGDGCGTASAELTDS